MATKGGPNIITDGLVLALDAANIKSFKGEPTTNLVTDPLNITSGFGSGAGVTRATGTLLNFTGQNNAGTITGNGTASYVAYVGNIGATTGNKYTTTWYLKAGTKTSVDLNWGGAHNGNRTNFTINLLTGAVTNLTLASGETYSVESSNNGFYKISYSSTLTGANYYPQISITTSVDYLIFGGIQIEQKPYATPFVNGTRGTTVATGGGWADLSANGNNGELLNGVRENSNNLGSLVFDGSNDYIQTPLTGTYTQILFEFWGFFDDPNLNMLLREESAFGDWTSNRVHFGTRWTGSNAGMHFNVNGVWQTTPTTNLRYGWNHYVLVYDTVNNLKRVYLNNILSSSHATNGNMVLGDFRIGVATNLNAYYRGNISNFKVYNRALTAAEIQQNYNATKSRFI